MPDDWWRRSRLQGAKLVAAPQTISTAFTGHDVPLLNRQHHRWHQEAPLWSESESKSEVGEGDGRLVEVDLERLDFSVVEDLDAVEPFAADVFEDLFLGVCSSLLSR